MRGERGQILIFVLVLMTIGMIVIAPLLSYVDTSLRLVQRTQANMNAYFAADAGMETVVEDLLLGEDIRTANYSASPISLNGYTVNITVAVPTVNTTAPPPSEEEGVKLYIDPGVAQGLNPLPAGEGTLPFTELGDNAWDFELVIPEGSTINVNWVHTRGFLFFWTFPGRGVIYLDVDSDPYNDQPEGGYIVASPKEWVGVCMVPNSYHVGVESPNTLNVSWETIEPYKTDDNHYHIIFENYTGYESYLKLFGFCIASVWVFKESNSQPFSSLGGSDYTWVLIGQQVEGEEGIILTYQDYIITSTAIDGDGNDIVKITAYARQTPGPAGWWLDQTVEILSWNIEQY